MYQQLNCKEMLDSSKQMNPQGLFVSPFILSCSEFPNNLSKYYKQMFLLMYLHDSIIKLACTQLIH